jgi:hypothetical protein
MYFAVMDNRKNRRGTGGRSESRGGIRRNVNKGILVIRTWMIFNICWLGSPEAGRRYCHLRRFVGRFPAPVSRIKRPTTASDVYSMLLYADIQAMCLLFLFLACQQSYRSWNLEPVLVNPRMANLSQNRIYTIQFDRR